MIRFAHLFPHLSADGFTETSPATDAYNCIAWAAGQADEWWWPDLDGMSYWPDGVPREETVSAFVRAFGTIGYDPCPDGDREPGSEKIAVYADGHVPTHAARQLPDGTWTSKLGADVDIIHTTPHGVEGGVYGRVCCFLRRPEPPPAPERLTVRPTP